MPAVLASLIAIAVVGCGDDGGDAAPNTPASSSSAPIVDCQSRSQIIPSRHPGRIPRSARKVSMFAGPVMFLGAKQWGNEPVEPRPGRLQPVKVPIVVEAGHARDGGEPARWAAHIVPRRVQAGRSDVLRRPRGGRGSDRADRAKDWVWKTHVPQPPAGTRIEGGKVARSRGGGRRSAPVPASDARYTRPRRRRVEGPGSRRSLRGRGALHLRPLPGLRPADTAGNDRGAAREVGSRRLRHASATRRLAGQVRTW